MTARTQARQSRNHDHDTTATTRGRLARGARVPATATSDALVLLLLLLLLRLVSLHFTCFSRSRGNAAEVRHQQPSRRRRSLAPCSVRPGLSSDVVCRQLPSLSCVARGPLGVGISGNFKQREQIYVGSIVRFAALT
ncbi:hypothetical protein DBV15_02812 [Temnothorax longispinosus]|uniref:Uncharacterized protein n=1 Tax=Temnothorax longispinosus TaxID=300112 RepID=A0A4S2L873_9HYME|nr:hypothetical protein DBV15_02812 [Temnothorax longispinosus]